MTMYVTKNLLFTPLQLLFVGTGKQVTACCKQAVYRVPRFRTLIDRSPSDAIFLEPSDELREDPFLLLDVLGYLGMPDPSVGQYQRTTSLCSGWSRWHGALASMNSSTSWGTL